MAEKTKLTLAGYKKLEEELDYLIHVVSEEVKVQLAEARAQGDLSENADYDAARNKQAEDEEPETEEEAEESVSSDEEKVEVSVSKPKAKKKAKAIALP